MITRCLSLDSYSTKQTFDLPHAKIHYYSLERLEAHGFTINRFPYSLKILLENLLRHENGTLVKGDNIRALAQWSSHLYSQSEIAFMPERVILQDFTGVPALVDLAAMRDALADKGIEPSKINPILHSDLVIDHSVQVDSFGHSDSFAINTQKEVERNRERYAFLKWGQQALKNFSVVPPGTGIVHQVNLEYLAQVVIHSKQDDREVAYPDTLIGTDSHTTMINGLGVLGWGVGGIEAEAAMLGQPITMLIPQIVGFKLMGQLTEGATATDLVLTITQKLREHGVVGKFVEFYGPGISQVSLATRATIGNMSPEYGSTCAIFPIDSETLRYLQFTGRSPSLVELVETYAKAQGLFYSPQMPEAIYSSSIELDLASVVPSISGPSRPQDRVPLNRAKSYFRAALKRFFPDHSGSFKPESQVGVPPLQMPLGVKESSPEAASVASFPASDPPSSMAGVTGEGKPDISFKPIGPSPNNNYKERLHFFVPVVCPDGSRFELDHGFVVIAAITSCTNTSNPEVMIAAGLLAKNAVERGLKVKPWVKTSLAPGSTVVMDYYRSSGLISYLEALRFHLVGFGCTTCIGNSGPLPPEISKAINEGNLVVCSVLSGNRNFEGRINPDVRMNYLASPPLVVAYALAGTLDIDFFKEPLGYDDQGKEIFLDDIWPSNEEVSRVIERSINSGMFVKNYQKVFEGDKNWHSLSMPEGECFLWDPHSTYVRRPPYFDSMLLKPETLSDILNARVLALLGDSVTTDHISPAGAIHPQSPAGQYLQEHGITPDHFNSYGSRRGNHEVMIRGTFANIRLRNLLVPGMEGGITLHFPDGERMSIYEAAMRYKEEKVPLIVLAGMEYGSGSSRDWAAKGTCLLGVRAVMAQSFERIHHSNLIGMGVLPLQFQEGQNAQTLGLTGIETFTIQGIQGLLEGKRELSITATIANRGPKEFAVRARIDTPIELEYYRHGGILKYILREFIRRDAS